ncbi:PepSY domain-containing protein [Flavihumibacter profundi]|uniref:PepSY domain-containing protein n=1 Tax=Flavihumibacter profundi TaxID=2716883 RepID=UPI001CC54635|nr:PepSY domain-containing protein [Flavihumibacter profundi]
MAYSFHVGSFAGSYSKVLYLFVGLSPAILSITGFMLWWRRKNYGQKRPKDK